MHLVQTRDHSHTLYIPELDETYHSRNGAVEEAMYVYIGRGLLDFVAGEKSIEHSPQTIEESNDHSARQETVDHGPWTIDFLEIGFGTGLNAWLTAMECGKLNMACNYTSLETFPLPVEITSQLNYTMDAAENDKQLFTALHQAEWNIPVSVTNFFTLVKLETSLQAFLPEHTFDIIYFDAFAPEKQPEMWTEELFRKLYDCLNPGGIIVTYSSKGEIRRLWKKIGFEVERLPGPPRKRHMLRGRKNV